MDPFDLRLWKGFSSAGGYQNESVIIDQITADSRRIFSPRALFVALPGKFHNGHDFVYEAANAGAAYILVQKGRFKERKIQGTLLLEVEDPLHALQEIAKAYRQQFLCHVIGITGSFGKTMVKDLLQQILSSSFSVIGSPESFNSQLGVPLSLLQINQHHQFAFIEAAISQKGEMDALSQMISPDYAILTSVGNKHLTTLESVETATREMVKLLETVPQNRWVFLPQEPSLHPVFHGIKAQKFIWNQKERDLPFASFCSKKRESPMKYQVDFPLGDIFRGEINSGFSYILDLLNMACKVAWKLGADKKSIEDALKSYVLEPSRTEIFKSMHGSTLINDTYCSDPQSIDKALRYFDQAPEGSKKYFLFGGMKRDPSDAFPTYRRIGEAIKKRNIDHLFLYGKHPFGNLVSSLGSMTTVSFCEDLAQALAKAKGLVRPEDVLLIKGEKKENLDLLSKVFNDSIPNNQCVINLAAIESNILSIKKALPPNNRIMVMVKALAYGTDHVRMAQFLNQCGIDILGVSYADEGVALKQAGVAQEIFVLNAAIYEAAKVVKWDLQIGVSDKDLVFALASEAEKLGKIIRVHLHVDTGMSRFGCRIDDALELARIIHSTPYLKLEGLMTHFSCADSPESDDYTLRQADLLTRTAQSIKNEGISVPWIHAANSSGAMRFHFPQFNMVRIGLAIYGLNSSKATSQALELRLALSLISRIVGINVCKKGDAVSYGRQYIVQKDQQRVAVLPMGYFDGLHRNYSGKGSVIIRGQKAPMVGTICMDFMMVDITDIPDAVIGDPVLIFGEDEHRNYLSPEHLASQGDSIVYELVTCLGPRIPRIFVYEEGQSIYETKK